MSVRDDVAAAATIADVTNVEPYYRQSLRPGDGFVRFGRRTRASNGFGFMDEWQVWLAVPTDEVTAEKWIEANVDQLVAKLGDVMIVTAVTPSEMILGSATVNGIIIAGTIPA